MARKPLTVCAEPSCGRLVPRGRCPEHQRERRRAPQRARYPGSDGASWDTLRRRVRKRDGGQYCALCGGVVNVDVHHVDGNRMNNDLSNLVQLCRRCHGQAHRRERA